MCRELVANWSRKFKTCLKFYAKIFAKIFRKTVARLSCDVRALSVANLSQREFGEFTMRTFRDTRTIWRENKTKRHSYECRAELSRMSCDCRTNEN